MSGVQKISGIRVTKMGRRVRGHNQLLEELKAHRVLRRLTCDMIQANEAVTYSHHRNQSLFSHDPLTIVEVWQGVVRQYCTETS